MLRNRRGPLFVVGALACAAPLHQGFGAPSGFRFSPQSVVDTVPSFISKALSPFRVDRDSAEVAALLVRWGEVDARSDVRSRIAAARLWRRAGEPDLARRALGDAPEELGTAVGDSGYVSVLALAASTLPALWELERARIGFSRRDPTVEQVKAAEGAFWRACGGASAELRRELWLDLRGLATPREQAEWETVAPGAATCDWVRRFVMERAWRMGVSSGERLAIHYRRLALARRLYSLPRPRFTRDLTDLLGRPDSLEVDDRGLVVLRMGRPTGTSGGATDGDLASGDLAYNWAYYRPDGFRLYYFAPVSRGGYRQVTDYRLQEHLGPEAARGHDFFQRYVTRATRGAAFLSSPSCGGVRVRAGRDRITLALDEAERRMCALHEQVLTTSYARYALQTIPDVPAVDARLRLRSEALRFANPERRTTSVWVLASVAVGDLTGTPQGGFDPEGITYHLAADLAYVAHGEERVEHRTSDVVLQGLPGEEDGLTLAIPLVLTEGPTPYTLVVRDLAAANEPSRGNWKQDTLRMPAQIPGMPAVSDLALAADSGGSWTRDGRTFLRVTPAHVARPSGVLHTYFEVYRVPLDARYEVEVRLVREKYAAQMYELHGDEVAFRLGFQARTPADSQIGRHHLRLELADTKPGTYVLGIRVRNLETGVVSLPSTATVRIRQSSKRGPTGRVSQ